MSTSQAVPADMDDLPVLRHPFDWRWKIKHSFRTCAKKLALKLQRDLRVSQKTVWLMLHRIREAWDRPGVALAGPVEVDETYIGGK